MPHVFDFIVIVAFVVLYIHWWRAGSRARDQAREAKRLFVEQRAQFAEKELLRDVEVIITTAHIDATRERVTAMEYINQHQLRWWEITPAELAHAAGVDEAVAAATIRTLHTIHKVLRDMGDE